MTDTRKQNRIVHLSDDDIVLLATACDEMIASIDRFLDDRTSDVPAGHYDQDDTGTHRIKSRLAVLHDLVIHASQMLVLTDR